MLFLLWGASGSGKTAVMEPILKIKPALDGIAACLLDCDDYERIQRIRGRGRGTEAATQDTLSWAAWMRMHARDPQWRPDVITNGGLSAMRWERWRDWQAGDPRWRTHRIDTSAGNLAQTVEHVAMWISREQKRETV